MPMCQGYYPGDDEADEQEHTTEREAEAVEPVGEEQAKLADAIALGMWR